MEQIFMKQDLNWKKNNFFPILIPIQFIIIYISFYTKIHSLFNNSIIKVFFLRKKKEKEITSNRFKFFLKIIDATFF